MKNRHFDTPPTKEVEEILRRRLVDDQVREYIFFTGEAQDSAAFEIFIELLASPPEDAPKEHPRRKAQVYAPITWHSHIEPVLFPPNLINRLDHTTA